MHEYAIADNLVTLATDAARKHEVSQVDIVHLQLGVLSGVVGEILTFCFDVATHGTPLQGAQLQIEYVPVIVYCATCEAECQLNDIQHLCCPICGTPTADVRQGREIKLISLEQLNETTEKARS